MLDRAGFEVMLVPPRMTKQISGHKSDVQDYQWIRQPLSYGLLRGAFRPADLGDRYSRRMVIENQIVETIDYFHMGALSAAVPMRIATDLKLTLMASELYRLLADRIGNGQRSARPRTLCRRFMDAAVTVSGHAVRVRFARRAHNPMMINAGFADTETIVPLLGGRAPKLEFGP